MHQWLVLVFKVTLANVMLMQSNVWTSHYSPSPILIHQSASDLLTLQFDLCMLMEEVLMRAGVTDGACIELDRVCVVNQKPLIKGIYCT